VIEVAAGYTDIWHFGGQWDVGENIKNGSVVSTSTVAAKALTLTKTMPLAVSPINGAWILGDIPAGSAKSQFTVTGAIEACPSRNGTRIGPGVGADYGEFVLRNVIPEDGSAKTVSLALDPGKSSTCAQWLRDGVHRGWAVPSLCAVSFGSGMAVDTNAVNVSGITSPATGRYSIALAQAAARASYTVTATVDGFFMAGWTVAVNFIATGSFEVRVFDTSNALANIPAGAVIHVHAVAGHI
jgi:hypothetical protein